MPAGRSLVLKRRHALQAHATADRQPDCGGFAFQWPVLLRRRARSARSSTPRSVVSTLDHGRPGAVPAAQMRFRALQRAQRDIDLRPEAYTHYYQNEFPVRHHAAMDTRRWGPGERIVFEPYTRRHSTVRVSGLHSMKSSGRKGSAPAPTARPSSNNRKLVDCGDRCITGSIVAWGYFRNTAIARCEPSSRYDESHIVGCLSHAARRCGCAGLVGNRSAGRQQPLQSAWERRGLHHHVEQHGGRRGR